MARDSKLKLIFTGDGADLRRELGRLIGDTDKATKSMDKFGKSGKAGLVAMGATLASVVSAGVAAGAVIGGLPVLLGGIAAVALSSNKQIQGSYVDLWSQIKEGTKDAASTLVPTFDNIADQLGSSFERMQPQIKQMMSSIGPDLEILVDGLTDMAERSLPGMATAAGRSTPVMQGLRDMLRQTGDGVSEFFEEISTGAPGAGSILSSLGGIIQKLLGFIGRLVAKLSNEGAPSVERFRQVFDQTVDVVENLAGGALPVLLDALGGALNMFSGILAVIAPIAGSLGHLIGIALSLGTAFRLMNVANEVFTSLSSKVKEVGSGMDATGGKAGGFKSKLSGLVSFMGGPAGIAVAVLGLGLALLGSNQEKAAEKARKHQAAVEGLRDAIRQDAGAIGDSTRQWLSNALAKDGVFDITKKLGLAEGEVTDAIAKGGPARDALLRYLDKKASIPVDKLNSLSEAEKQEAIDAGTAAKAIRDKGAEVEEAARKEDQYKKGIQASGTAMTTAASGSEKLRAAYAVLSDAAADAGAKTKALLDIMDQLTGGTQSYQEAQQSANDTNREFNEWLSQGIDKAKGFGAALLNVDGTVNTTTENGSKLRDFAQSAAEDFAGLGQAAFEYAINQGKSVGEATQFAKDQMAQQRQAFIDTATKMGLLPEQAAALADGYGLIPDIVATTFTTPGMTQAQSDLLLVRQLVNNVPVGKAIKVTSLSDEAQAKLRNLGFEVRQLPDGSFSVIANTAAARNKLNDLTKTETKHINVVVDYRNPSGKGGGHMFNARGNIVKAFADGGFNSMRGGLAQIVPPNTWRIIGDRVKDDEAYIPINQSGRSQALLRETAQRMGYQLVKPMADGGIIGNGSTAGTINIDLRNSTIVGKNGMDELAAVLEKKLNRRATVKGR